MQHQLCSEKEDESVRKQLVDALKNIKPLMESDAAVIPHLEMLVVDGACNDPGAYSVNNLVLPIIRERIDVLAKKHNAKKAAEAQEAVKVMTRLLQTLSG